MPCCRSISAFTGREYARQSSHPVFEYLYSHRATYSVYNLLTTPLLKLALVLLARAAGWDMLPVPPGTCHADDALMMFTNALAPFSPVITEEDRQANEALWTMWSSFAKTGDPNPEEAGQATWQRYCVDNFKMLGVKNLKEFLSRQRLDPSHPRHLRIGGGKPFLAMVEDSPAFSARLSRWGDIWSKVSAPRLHNTMSSRTWKDPKTRSRGPKEEEEEAKEDKRQRQEL